GAPAFQHGRGGLSPGGGDAVEVREFDAGKLAFAADGFPLPLAKTNVRWRDADSLFVATDYGPGTMTSSGYARIVKLWRRGTPLATARTLIEGKPESFQVNAYRMRSDAGDVDLVTDNTSFWTTDYYQLVGDKVEKLDLPPTAEVSDLYQGKLLVSLKEDWTRGGRTFKQDSVVIADPAALRGAAGAGGVDTLVEAAGNEVVES